MSMPYPAEIAWAKFRVTMVMICAIAILGVLFYLLTGGGFLAAKTVLYLYLPDAAAVGPKSPVRVNGITVGKVRSVALTGSSDPNRIVIVEMTVEVAHLRSIPVDSYAEINSDNLLGDRYVDISSGKQPAFIQPGGEIRYQPPTDLMKKLDITQFERQLRKIDVVLGDIEQGKTRVGELLVEEQMYSDLLRRMTELRNGIRRATATTGQIGGLLYTETLYSRIHRPLAELDQALARVQSGQGTAGQWLRDASEHEKMRAGMADLRAALADLHAGRGAGGEFLVQDAAWRSIERSVESMMAAVDRVNAGPLFQTSELYDNLNGISRELRDSLREFRRHPERYMRVKLF